jgi:hypothetical protein
MAVPNFSSKNEVITNLLANRAEIRKGSVRGNSFLYKAGTINPIEISIDDGVNWQQITIGQQITFTDDNYFANIYYRNPTGSNGDITQFIIVDGGIANDVSLVLAGAIAVKSPSTFLQCNKTIVSNTPVNIRPFSSSRARLTIANKGASDLFIGGTNTVSSGGTFPSIPAGSSLTVETQGDIWAIRASAGTETVDTFEEV